MKRSAKRSADLKIERGIPIPTRKLKAAPPGETGVNAVLRRMELGDSVFFADTLPKQVTSRAALIFGPGNYTTQVENNGTRLWRTK